MTKQKFYIIIIFALLLLNIVLVGMFLTAKGPRDARPRGMRERPKNIVIERLDFSEDQITAYSKLIEGHQMAIEDRKQEVVLLNKKLYGTLLGTPSSSKEEEITAEIGLIEASITKTNLQHFRDIKSICTPNQLEKFDALTKDLVLIFNPKRPK